MLCEEAFAERSAIVVVSHHPDDLRTEAGRHGLDHLAQPVVGVWLALVGQVAREDDCFRPPLRGLELVQQLAQVGLGVDAAVEALAVAEQVSVTEVEQKVVRPRIFGRSDGHGASIRVTVHSLRAHSLY